jgi:hypothetical protein
MTVLVVVVHHANFQTIRDRFHHSRILFEISKKKFLNFLQKIASTGAALHVMPNNFQNSGEILIY